MIRRQWTRSSRNIDHLLQVFRTGYQVDHFGVEFLLHHLEGSHPLDRLYISIPVHYYDKGGKEGRAGSGAQPSASPHHGT